MLKQEIRPYTKLSDAKVLPEGDTVEIWYSKSSYQRDSLMGYKWLKQRDIAPDPNDLESTHTLLGTLGDRLSNSELYYRLQGLHWSPQGEAYELIRGKELSHTSISVGDIIVRNGKAYFVDVFGFQELN